MLASLLFQNTRTGIDNPLTGRALPELSSLDVYEDLPPGPGDAAPFTGSDAFGMFYARRRKLGTMPLFGDASSRMVIPGGVPIVLRGTFAFGAQGISEHFQREEMQFYPGEYAHQAFPAQFFNGMCGGCHGSLSGKETDLSVQPDILTQASLVQAVSGSAANFSGPPSSRGAEVGPMD